MKNGLILKSKTNKRMAFTLAEVLITLGIIGVVAAMTLPTLIASHKKKVVITRLKQDYSILMQAMTMAQAEYGDPNEWDISMNYSNKQKRIPEIVEKYFVPYLSGIKNNKYISLKDANYPVYYTHLGDTNTNLALLNSQYYIIEFNNGSTIFFECEATGYLLIYVDVNGKAKPNIWGRDTFMLRVYPKVGRLEFLNTIPPNREKVLELCKNSGLGCGALIQMDEWEFKEDYPIGI